MKSKFLFFITIIISACIIIASYSYWQTTLNKANEDIVVDHEQVGDKKKDKKKKSNENNANNDNEVEQVDLADEFTIANKNEVITEKVEERLAADEPLRFLFIGSERMTSDGNNLPDVFANIMDEKLASLVEVEQYLFADNATLITVVNSDELNALNKEDYDFVIFEPFTYSNHGLISYEDTEFYLQQFLTSWEDTDAVVIVHPAARITSLEYGPERYEHIKDAMSSRPEVFIDIWDDIEDDATFSEYITENGSPTDAGLDYWATELASYFVQMEGSNN